MGINFSCITDTTDDIPYMQRLQYDMTPIKSKNLPIIWLLGARGSGRHTQAKLLVDKLKFEEIRVAQILRQEAERDTDRGKIINEGLHHRLRPIPEDIVIDLIKEEMLKKSRFATGFVINNFPKTALQAQMFEKEIGGVHIIFYLVADVPLLLSRIIEKEGRRMDEEALKKSIQEYRKEAKAALAKYDDKVEKIWTDEPLGEIFGRLQSALNVRLTSTAKIALDVDQKSVEDEL